MRSCSTVPSFYTLVLAIALMAKESFARADQSSSRPTTAKLMRRAARRARKTAVILEGKESSPKASLEIGGSTLMRRKTTKKQFSSEGDDMAREAFTLGAEGDVNDDLIVETTSLPPLDVQVSAHELEKMDKDQQIQALKKQVHWLKHRLDAQKRHFQDTEELGSSFLELSTVEDELVDDSPSLGGSIMEVAMDSDGGNLGPKQDIVDLQSASPAGKPGVKAVAMDSDMSFHTYTSSLDTKEIANVMVNIGQKADDAYKTSLFGSIRKVNAAMDIMFTAWDLDEDGTIEKSEMEQVMKEYCPKDKPDQVFRFFNADKSDQGIVKDEFVHAYPLLVWEFSPAPQTALECIKNKIAWTHLDTARMEVNLLQQFLGTVSEASKQTQKVFEAMKTTKPTGVPMHPTETVTYEQWKKLVIPGKELQREDEDWEKWSQKAFEEVNEEHQHNTNVTFVEFVRMMQKGITQLLQDEDDPLMR